MKKRKKELDLIIDSIIDYFEKIYFINKQAFSINGNAKYCGKKCFFKIVDEELFIKEIK